MLHNSVNDSIQAALLNDDLTMLGDLIEFSNQGESFKPTELFQKVFGIREMMRVFIIRDFSVKCKPRSNFAHQIFIQPLENFFFNQMYIRFIEALNCIQQTKYSRPISNPIYHAFAWEIETISM